MCDFRERCFVFAREIDGPPGIDGSLCKVSANYDFSNARHGGYVKRGPKTVGFFFFFSPLRCNEYHVCERARASATVRIFSRGPFLGVGAKAENSSFACGSSR